MRVVTSYIAVVLVGAFLCLGCKPSGDKPDKPGASNGAETSAKDLGAKALEDEDWARAYDKFTDAIAADPLAFKPGYAVAFKILKADADTVLETKNYAVIGVVCENRFYGNWSRQGETKVYDLGGNLASTDTEAASLADERVYTLSTVDAGTVRCNKVDGSSGDMLLTFDGNAIRVSSADGTVTGTGSFNGAKLLQDRKLTLDYTVTTPTGRKEVKDILSFRNRIRDGVNEWQDENPAHYN